MSSYVLYNESSVKGLFPFKKIKKYAESFLMNFVVCMLFTGPPTALFSFVSKLLGNSYYVETAIAVFIITLFFTLLYIILNNHTNKKIKASIVLHECVHSCRDAADAILSSSLDINKQSSTLGELCKSLCENTKKFFDEIKKSDVGVAIRIARKDGANDTYNTYGRAGLSSSRRRTTEPLLKNAGVAKILLDNDASGCLIYKDVRDASEAEYVRMKNDKHYKDVVSMLAVPVNGNDGERMSMIGILYISSKKEGFFSQDDVEFAKAFADAAALLLSYKVCECEFKKRGRK